ncbi:MAG: hypothetical protein H6830_11100 [Planctomycetes bacterium]|nr:hypothetical protein [Planctomycetota bacterium]HPF13975.1 hypothetical protein [Planctomycetota bacterium]HRV80288.1 hypothetical protein [Planctomycetota bacterium]
MLQSPMFTIDPNTWKQSPGTLPKPLRVALGWAWSRTMHASRKGASGVDSNVR